MPRHQNAIPLAFVVGGSEGIGLAVAEALTGRGGDVVVLSRSAAKLEAALARLEARRTSPGQRLVCRALDVTDATATTSTVDTLVAELGTPELVVDTAGFARPGWLGEVPLEDVRAMMEVNFFGTLHVCHAVVPHLVRAGGGTIVTTSSMAGLAGVFGYTGYCASKFAVVGFSQALRRELRPYGVRVQVLCPPNTRTPGFDEENRHKPAEVLAAEETVTTLEPEAVAAELLAALGSRRFLVIPGRDGRLAHVAMRLAPSVVDRMLRRPEPVR